MVRIYCDTTPCRDHRYLFSHHWCTPMLPNLIKIIGPFANVLSIAALVSYWRENLAADGSQLYGITIKDPHWATALNVASLATGYVGNFFLFCNFTQRIRYMIALPATVVLWFISAFLVCIILFSKIYNQFDPIVIARAQCG